MNSEFLLRLSEFIKSARRIETTGTPRLTAASEVVGALPDSIVRGMATYYLADKVERAVRAEALNVERQAEAQPGEQDVEEPPAAPPDARRRPPRRGTRAWLEWIETPEGAEHEQEYQFWKNKREAGLMKIIDDYTREMRMIWTRELLATSFALPDGSTVTWGAATLDQHRARQTMFVQNAHANLEGAARHEHAIRDIEAANAQCLNDLPAVAA